MGTPYAPAAHLVLFSSTTTDTKTVSAQRDETETKQSRNGFETVLTVVCFSFISLCGQFKTQQWTKTKHVTTVVDLNKTKAVAKTET